MGRGFSFRLLYRVVFFSFGLIFACFYHGGGSEYDRREDKTELNKLKDELKGKPLNVDVSLEQDERVSNLTENAKQIDGAWSKIDLPKMVRKETAMKTLRSETQKSPVLAFSTSSLSEVNVPRKESTTISHSNETKWQNDGSKNISSLENQFFHKNDLRETAKRETSSSLTTQHLRSRREIDSKSEYTQEDLLMCNDSIINIKNDDKYKVRTDFSILYKNKVYDYTEYRVLNDSITICNSTDNYVRNIWKVRNKWLKATMHQQSCNKPIRESRLYRNYYTVNKEFTVYFVPRNQYFTRNDYGVRDGKPHMCDEQFRPISTEYTQEDLLMCNDSIINIKNDDKYNVRTEFSIFYGNILCSRILKFAFWQQSS
ncbi:Hypothetical predicted protein [Paramuricea clavata]|uniref:Uncharacterized protein n=1 Tax=Paramuricea clavata TaxID=317549 RepID=A0A7D9DV63_PARCT|nr:Hypothetical predicted protein [Paramuricea clavata]